MNELSILTKRAMSFPELKKKATKLGIKSTGKGVTADHLRREIARVEAGGSVSSPPAQTTSKPARKAKSGGKLPKGAKIKKSNKVETLNLIGADYTVFAGSHIFLDDYVREKLRERLTEVFEDETELAFYNDGENLEVLQEHSAAGTAYLEALEADKGKHKLNVGAIGFETNFPLELYGVLRDGIIEVGGFDNPTSISLITGTGDIKLAVYHFDTYM